MSAQAQQHGMRHPAPRVPLPLTLPVGQKLFFWGLVESVYVEVVGYTDDGRYFLRHFDWSSKSRERQGFPGWHAQTRATERTVRNGRYRIEPMLPVPEPRS